MLKKKKATVSKGRRIRVKGRGHPRNTREDPSEEVDLGMQPEDGCLHQATNAHWAPELG